MSGKAIGTKNWTPEEDAILKTYYKNGRTCDLLQMLPGRSRIAITQRASKFGIRKQGITKFIVEGEITKLELVQKDGVILYAIIDTEDMLRVKELNVTWIASWCSYTRSYYAIGKQKVTGNKWRTLSLSRVILNCPDGLLVDHINHDTLDNRKSNLRPVTALINAQNLKDQKMNSSGIRGVTWHKGKNKWIARFQYNYQTYQVGQFDTISEAAEAIKLAREEYMKNLIETSS